MPPAPALHPQGEQDLFARICLFAETARRREGFAGCEHVASGREVQPPMVNGPGPIVSVGSLLRPSIGVSSRPGAAAESLFTNDPSLVRCGRPETSIMGIVFDGRRAKVGDISTWKF